EDGSINRENMNSYNHYAYGAVCQWLFEYVAGMRPCDDEPGFTRVEFSPLIVPELSPVSVSHAARTGRITASWAVDGSEVAYRFTVPPRARGTLRLLPEYQGATLNGQPLHGVASVSDLAPGDYLVTFSLTEAAEADRLL